MPDRDLNKLANIFATRATSLENDFLARQDVSSKAFSVISLYAIWEEFSRRLLFSSASAQPTNAQGRTIARAAGIRTTKDVELKLKVLKRLKPHYQLILHLGSPVKMVEACKYLALTNESVISPAILSVNSPAEELRVMRNFLAHQNPGTAVQVSAASPVGQLGVGSAVGWLGQLQLGGRTRFGAWSSDLVDVARACVN